MIFDNYSESFNTKTYKIRQNSKDKQPKLVEGLIPIKNTTLIDSKKLIQSYRSPKGKKLKVLNWFNCSFIEYKSKIYFVYRVEPKPYCTVMKIGICLLDGNQQPLKNTNVLLDLHTDLEGYEKGFHAEDPRLFIHNDELYLSYTDGYQMVQAKINPTTLQTEKSFYIDKPIKARTEKNWVFFSHKGQLYSIYTSFNQTILKMNEQRWKKSYSSQTITWKYGEIRGGTSPILVGDKYITFFHSSLGFEHRGQPGRQYFMGAYTFESKPPFKMISISTQPIIVGELMDDSISRLDNKIFVVFPCGVIQKPDSFLVSFGYNDYECRVVEITNELLGANMKIIKN